MHRRVAICCFLFGLGDAVGWEVQSVHPLTAMETATAIACSLLTVRWVLHVRLPRARRRRSRSGGQARWRRAAQSGALVAAFMCVPIAAGLLWGCAGRSTEHAQTRLLLQRSGAGRAAVAAAFVIDGPVQSTAHGISAPAQLVAQVTAQGWRPVSPAADVLLEVIVPHPGAPSQQRGARSPGGESSVVLEQDYADLAQLRPGVRVLAYAYLRVVAPGRFAVALMRRNITVEAMASIYGVSVIGTQLDINSPQTASAAALYVIIQRASGALGPTAANLLAAFAFGDRSGVPTTLVSALTVIGIVHAFVASGATIRMTIAPLERLARQHLPRDAAFVVAALALCTIVLLTGFAPPALRASCVFGYDLVATRLGRPRDALTANGLALCVLAAVSPALLVDPGVILSLCAVTGLQWLPPLIGQWPLLRWIRGRQLRQWVARGCGAELCVTPLVAALFGQFAVLSLVINIFVYAVLEWVIPISAVTLCSCALAPQACQWMHPIAGAMARSFVADVEALAHLPLVLTILHPSYVDVLIYYAVLWGFVQCVRRFAWRRRRIS